MRLAFIAPWYGQDALGGAEAELRGLLQHLKETDAEIEVLTTCVRGLAYDWNENYHKPGETLEEGITVRRFWARLGRKEIYRAINEKLLAFEAITPEEERQFVEEGINSLDLYSYIAENKDSYDLFIFIPYMFGTTYYGCGICSDKTVLIPCFHDEPYFHMGIFKERFSKVRGMIFHSLPESDLARKHYDLSNVSTAVLGEGVDTDFTPDAHRFREKYKIKKPFILCAGRKHASKGTDTLLDYFARYKSDVPGDLGLVLIGPESLPIPGSIQNDVFDLGFVPKQDKYDACGAALALCNLSKNESFSLAAMESWLAYRPVIVNSICAVTSHFVEQSQGGLSVNDYNSFKSSIDYLLENRNEADEMGARGRQYVLQNFSWDAVVDKYLEFFRTQGDGSPVSQREG